MIRQYYNLKISLRIINFSLSVVKRVCGVAL